MRTKRQVQARLNSITDLIAQYNVLINKSESLTEALELDKLKDRAIAMRDELLWVLKEIN